MHPWEDFAETFAHLMHIIDALATLDGFGMRMTKWSRREEDPSIDFDPYHAQTEQLIQEWRPFAFAENAINRSMGQADLYPFQLSTTIIAKLDYINRPAPARRGRAISRSRIRRCGRSASGWKRRRRNFSRHPREGGDP
jgi:hypothetical protein